MDLAAAQRGSLDRLDHRRTPLTSQHCVSDPNRPHWNRRRSSNSRSAAIALGAYQPRRGAVLDSISNYSNWQNDLSDLDCPNTGGLQDWIARPTRAPTVAATQQSPQALETMATGSALLVIKLQISRGPA